MKLKDTLTRKLQEIVPLEGDTVKLYTCGLTVYSQPHIGNWVSYIYWDVLQRALEANGYKVQRTQNITDVGHLVSDDDSGDDKMQKSAEREGISAWDIAKKYTAIVDHEAYDLLKLKRPTTLARATDFIKQQIKFVQDLETEGFTYIIPGEGVYFDTSKLSDYGKLAQLDIKGLKAGARVPIKGKRTITDFALWKLSPKDQKRDMEWDSPWGKGFPGWHLECSVIAKETLGEQIDIHTGGVDHIPVHHTNEIAQTESLTGKPFASIWLHNNHLKINGGKMSKSLSNVYTLKDVTDKGFNLMAYKLFVLSKFYSTEGNFTWDNVNAAQNRLLDIQAWADLRWQSCVNDKLEGVFKAHKKTILKALSNDLNTPEVFRIVSKVLDATDEDGADSKAIGDFAAYLDELLGLGLCNSKDITKEQKTLVTDRAMARKANDWSRADELRDKLQQQGIEVLDTQTATLWRRSSL